MKIFLLQICIYIYYLVCVHVQILLILGPRRTECLIGCDELFRL
jgi:hypothetical protein